MEVSCSCGGDSVLYRWTLDGRTLDPDSSSITLDGHNLMDEHLLSGRPDSTSITLPVGTSGRLACDVSNNVSRDAAYEVIKPCAGETEHDYWAMKLN